MRRRRDVRRLRARDVRYGLMVKFRGYRLSFAGVKPAVVGETLFRDDDLVAIATNSLDDRTRARIEANGPLGG